jgi:hypothetical protein
MKAKKSGIVEELIGKYKARLARAHEKLENEYERGRPILGCESYCANTYLFQKWAYRVGKGWYGFSVDDIPQEWAVMINDFLAWVETQCPDFEIHQIKIKCGRLCVYVETKCGDKAVNESVHSEIRKLESLLCHEHLIR